MKGKKTNLSQVANLPFNKLIHSFMLLDRVEKGKKENEKIIIFLICLDKKVREKKINIIVVIILSHK